MARTAADANLLHGSLGSEESGNARARDVGEALLVRSGRRKGGAGRGSNGGDLLGRGILRDDAHEVRRVVCTF